MVLVDPEVVNSFNGSSITAIQAVAEEVGVEIAAEHLALSEHVWRRGARFAILPGRLPGKGMGVVAARDIEVRNMIFIQRMPS